MKASPADGDFLSWLGRNLLWSGVVTLLVGTKLVLSYFVPGLRTPGELVLSGGLLLIYTVRLFNLRAAVANRAGAP